MERRQSAKCGPFFNTFAKQLAKNRAFLGTGTECRRRAPECEPDLVFVKGKEFGAYRR